MIVHYLPKLAAINYKGVTANIAFEPDWHFRVLSVITDPSVAMILMLVGVLNVIWGIAAAGAAMMNEQERRGPRYLVFALTTMVSVAYLLRHETLLLGLGLVGHAIAMIFLLRKERARLVSVSIAIALILAMTQSRDLLAARPAYPWQDEMIAVLVLDTLQPIESSAALDLRSRLTRQAVQLCSARVCGIHRAGQRGIDV